MIFHKNNLYRALIYVACIFVFNMCAKKLKPVEDEITTFENALILISMDGFRWDYIQFANTPHLDEFIRGGVQSEGIIPPFPSKTFPSHISLVTGKHPEEHGILSNKMYDPVFDEYYYIGQNSKPVLEEKWYEAEPIWVTAEKQNKRAMTMFWPASEAEIMGVRPTEYFIYDESISNSERVSQILKWVDYPERKRGNFFSLYFSDIDSKGHKYGPNSKEVYRAVEKMDSIIGELVDGLKDRKVYNNINIIITTDHGMASTSEDSVIFLDDYIDLEDIEVVDWGPASAILPKVDIKSIYSKLIDAHPKLDVFMKGSLPKNLHYNNHRRIQPIIAIAHEHWSITDRKTYNSNPDRYNGGNHGYYSNYDSMRGIFLARGPGFKSGFKGPGFNSIHLYELMCYLLKIQPTDNSGFLDSTRIYLTAE
jgi:predicted AlkP superfamily pyrophosphatase or phosphodiesterase